MAQVFKNGHLKERALNAFFQLSHSSFSIPAIQAKARSGKLVSECLVSKERNLEMSSMYLVGFPLLYSIVLYFIAPQ